MRRLALIAIALLVLLSGCAQNQENTQGEPPAMGKPEGGAPPGENQGTPQQPGPSPQEPQGATDELAPPAVNTDAPLPELPAGITRGEWITKNIGDVEIRYFSTAIIRGMTESGTDHFITLKNNGAEEEEIGFLGAEELLGQVPRWNLHFFDFQDPPITLAPGEERKLWYYASLDSGDGEHFTVNFRVWLADSPSTVAELPVEFGTAEEIFTGKETSIIYGYVRGRDGGPVANAEISAAMNCGRLDFRGSSDSGGRYYIKVLAMEDIDAIYLGKELGCDSTDYYLSAKADGYEYYFSGNLAPTRKEFARHDIVLDEEGEPELYALEWQTQAEDNYGFFWVKPSDDWSVFAANQAKHPPELGKPTNIYLIGSDGKILWAYPTENECWGIAIAGDGSKVIAGCHDKTVYAVSREGNLLWSFNEGGMVRSACISKDGSKALSGAIGTLRLFNAENGAKTDIAWGGQWLRNCVFYPGNGGFVVGSRELAGYDESGKMKWLQVIGEFPLFLGVDNGGNIFAAGKNRTLFSFDKEGNLRWKRKIPDHVVTAGAVTPDGSRIAVGTVGGMVYVFDNSGGLLWKRSAKIGEKFGAIGHNAIAVSDDGTRVIAGIGEQNCIVVYNGNGTALWNDCRETGALAEGLLKGVTSVQISPDKREIIAAYGDNYMRKFLLR